MLMVVTCRDGICGTIPQMWIWHHGANAGMGLQRVIIVTGDFSVTFAD